FVIAAQIGGRMLDRAGAKRPVFIGCVLAAVGFWLWGESLDKLSFGEQWYYLAIAGLGVGLVLGPVSTDALNRAARATYGAVTGLTQTVRNFGGSLGLAVLGSILITETISHVRDGLTSHGVPKAEAERIAHSVSSASSGGGSSESSRHAASNMITHQVQLGFAHATQIVVYGMAGAMALAFIVAVRAMPGGRAGEAVETSDGQTESSSAAAPASGATPAGA
ncbi:MAG TPA: MFS transporter, partial [Solirubrobacteraceae bacterium]|nr:MFS transporter [Solirubrobacteraceae bacterium]